MGYIRILLLFVVFGIVKIGDFVSLLFSSAASLLGRLWDVSRYRYVPLVLPEKEVLYRSKKSFVPSVSFRYVLLFVRLFFLRLFFFMFREVSYFLDFCRTLLVWFLRLPLYVGAFFLHRRSKRVVPSAASVRVKILFFGFGAFFSFMFFFLPLLFFIFISDLPHPSQLSNGSIPKTTKIFDRNGELLYEIFVSQNRTPVPLSEIPSDLIHATIAIEDKDFYSHPGFDVRGMGRAFYENTTTDSLQGGSTITQQLIKSALLTPEPTISRKVKEIALAFWAERVYSKDEILEMYFNFIPYGGTAWGISAASEAYFDKGVTDLTLAESAFLAGLPRAPSVYSPFVGDGESWRRRQKFVLDAMVNEGYISEQQASEAYAQPLAFASHKTPLLAPHFVMYVRDALIQKYGIGTVERGGLHVTTSLDLRLQKEVERAVAEEVDKGEALHISNGAAVVTDPTNGDVLAMVGSRDYFDQEQDGNVNVTRMKRQPGSTIKLVTYALALESGYTEATLLDDSPLAIEQAGAPPYRPVNYDGQFHGRVPLRMALANSYNIPAVRIAQDVGADAIVDLGTRMGIDSWKGISSYGLSITLGGEEVTMLDLATAYGTVANGGERVELDPILEVRDSNGRVIHEKRVPQGVRVLSSGTAFILSDILADNRARSIEFGVHSPLHIPGHFVPVKTGTTDEKRDNWTVGYSGNRLAAVWVGNNDNSPMSPRLTSGLSGAAPIWNRIMSTILSSAPPSPPLPIPSDVVVQECYGRRIYVQVGEEGDVRCSSNSRSTFFRPAQVQ